MGFRRSSVRRPQALLIAVLSLACGGAESGEGVGVPSFGGAPPTPNLPSVSAPMLGPAATPAAPPAAPAASESPGTPPLQASPPANGNAGATQPGADAGVPGAAPGDSPPEATPPEATPPASGVVPSAGCGRGGRPAGGAVTVDGDHIYTFPASYDGQTPMPLIFAFHANANPIDQIRTLTNGSALQQSFVMAFPKSVGAGWVLGTDAPRLDRWYDELLANYCIDTSRVFATGHSSGAQFIVQLLCQGEDRFRAIAPVASSMYCQSWNPIDTLLIHGANDMERANTNQDANGRKDLGPYLASNGCDMTTTPYATPGCTSGNVSVDPGCVSYSGCDKTMIWCSHNDPSYSNTNHGWPCFANQAMMDFFSGIR
jgi:polyhydroxybutyrate depolymerase